MPALHAQVPLLTPCTEGRAAWRSQVYFWPGQCGCGGDLSRGRGRKVPAGDRGLPGVCRPAGAGVCVDWFLRSLPVAPAQSPMLRSHPPWPNQQAKTRA